MKEHFARWEECTGAAIVIPPFHVTPIDSCRKEVLAMELLLLFGDMILLETSDQKKIISASMLGAGSRMRR